MLSIGLSDVPGEAVVKLYSPKCMDVYTSKSSRHHCAPSSPAHCPHVYCEKQPMLPISLSDVPGEAMVKFYCPKCTDVYTSKSSRHHYTGLFMPSLPTLFNTAMTPNNYNNNFFNM